VSTGLESEARRGEASAMLSFSITQIRAKDSAKQRVS
jgi:hypothetical protein